MGVHIQSDEELKNIKFTKYTLKQWFSGSKLDILETMASYNLIYKFCLCECGEIECYLPWKREPIPDLRNP